MLRVQFASDTYSALESSGDMTITVIITGGTPTVMISVNVNFSGSTATG